MKKLSDDDAVLTFLAQLPILWLDLVALGDMLIFGWIRDRKPEMTAHV